MRTALTCARDPGLNRGPSDLQSDASLVPDPGSRSRLQHHNKREAAISHGRIRMVHKSSNHTRKNTKEYGVLHEERIIYRRNSSFKDNDVHKRKDRINWQEQHLEFYDR